MVNLGRAIREVRERKKLSQDELAKLTQLSQSYISHIETGYKQPSFPTLDRIALELGTNSLSLIKKAERLTKELKQEAPA